jgi:hypothetical protein
MSVSSRMFWNLIEKDLMLEFVNWVRKTYPESFKNLVDQFHKEKEEQ